MSNYTFTFKKDDIFVEFTTTDKDIVVAQFQTWVNCATEYSKTHVKKSPIAPQPEANQPERAIEEKVEEVQPEPIIEEQIIEEIAAEIEPEQPLVQEPTATEEESAPIKTEGIPEVFDQASTLLRTINTIQSDAPTEKAPEMPDFEAILENSLETSTFEPVKTKDGNFLQLINIKNTQDKFHYLIITAYYLLEHEKLERFSLKQINAKLMQNLSQVIDHTVLQDAINAGFVEAIPDLTGESDISEYRLTDRGESFFMNEI